VVASISVVKRLAWVCSWLAAGLACAPPGFDPAPESSTTGEGTTETETQTETQTDTTTGVVECTRVVVADVNVETDEQMAALADVIEIQGDLRIGFDTLTELVGAHCLERITGTLAINNNPSLERIDDALTGLHSVGNMFVMDNPALVSLTGLRALERIESRAIVGDNPVLVELRFDALTAVGENLTVGGASLPNLLGLSSLTEVGGLLTISNSDSLVDLDGLQNLATAGLTSYSGLHIMRNTALLSLDGITLQNLRRLRITDNPALVDLGGLESVVTIENGLEIEQNDALTSLVGLDNLVEVPGDHVSIVNNPALQSLAGLDGLRELEHLHVCNNAVLDDLGALADLETLERFTVTYNDVLPGSEPDAIAAGLPDIEWVKIDANGPLDPLWWDKNPCPWSGDFVCDEDFEYQGDVGIDCVVDCCDMIGPTNLCAEGTDDDCANGPIGPP
jgi:hypothetical protein